MHAFIYGIGTDLVDAGRFIHILKRFPKRIESRLLSQPEQEVFHRHHHKESFLAKRWAAKEALSKALGLGFRQGLRMNECEVTHSPLGQPKWKFYGQSATKISTLPIGEIHLSISDEPPFALAFVVITRRHDCTGT